MEQSLDTVKGTMMPLLSWALGSSEMGCPSVCSHLSKTVIKSELQTEES